jgi:hypothetical protein
MPFPAVKESKKPRTARVLAKAGSAANIRLSNADRSFLEDLGKAGIVDLETANQFHYSERQSGGVRRLDKLCSAGIVECIDIGSTGTNRPVKAYRFASKSIARSFGGHMATFGTNKGALHEWLVGRAYFELERPEGFRVAARFTLSDNGLFGSSAPDAVAQLDNGTVVLVEADSGHYTKVQIMNKQIAWSGHDQFWIQPKNAMSVIPVNQSITATRI